jgi:hypothetical protein
MRQKPQNETSHERRRRALLKLTPKIQSLYDKQHLIDPSDQNLFATPIRDLLDLPTHTIENWLYKAEIRVKDSLKRQKNFTQQNMQPIRNFFQRLIPLVIIRQQPNHPRPIHQPHDIAILPAPRQLIATTIRNFFQRITLPNLDPDIPIPRNDDRPP